MYPRQRQRTTGMNITRIKINDIYPDKKKKIKTIWYVDYIKFKDAKKTINLFPLF